MHEADKQESGAEDEADFEIDVVEDALELWVGRQEAFLGAEDAGADGEDGDVGSDEDEAEGVGKGVDVEGPAADGLGAGEKPERDDESDEKRDDAGVEEEPAWAEEEKEAEVTPAIAPGSEVGWAAAAVWREGGGDLGHAEAGEGGFDDHLAGELHAGGAEVEREDGVAAEGAKAAVEVADGDAEEDAADGGEDGVAEVTVKRWHGSGLDGAGEAVAHDEVVAFVEFWEEAGEVFEVVAGVGVGHEDVFAAGGLDAGDEGGSVAADGHVDDAGAFVGGDLLRAVGAAVVGDYDLAGDVVVAKGGDGLANAESESLCFVEAGHKDGDQQLAHYLNATKGLTRAFTDDTDQEPATTKAIRVEMRLIGWVRLRRRKLRLWILFSFVGEVEGKSIEVSSVRARAIRRRLGSCRS